MEFHKNVMKVMLAIVLMFAIDYGAGLMWMDYIKPLKNEIYARGLGSDYLECLKSFKPNPDLLKDVQVQAAQRTINIYIALFLIVQIGILYLFSCFIVRHLSKPKSNKLSEPTP